MTTPPRKRLLRHLPTALPLTVPQVKPGECQALVVVPAKFEPRTEQVVIKDAAKSYEIVPAEYEWTEEQVVIKPASKKLEIVPAVFETVEEQIEVEPAMTTQEVIPPQYTEVKEEIVAKPAYMTARSEGPARTFSSAGEALRMVEARHRWKLSPSRPCKRKPA